MKKALIFGAGNIGRGFIGQLFSQSGYEVVFLDIDEGVIGAINRERSYPISIVSNDTSKEIMVSPVRGLNVENEAAVATEMVEADLIATAVGMRALDKVSATIANGLKKRWEKGNFNPVNIIICENMLHADKFMEKVIISGLSIEGQRILKETVGFVEASIGRMVPVVVQKNGDNPLRIFVEEYDELPVDKEGFKGEIPNINNMIPYSPFIYYIHRKLFMHNLGHAITAYLGAIQGHHYIWEAIADPTIRGIVASAFGESAKAMALAHDVPMEDLLKHAEELMARFGNRALGDTIERVARDPIRKLSAKDRLGGGAILCSRHDILPTNICLGIAAGLLYQSPEDQGAMVVQQYIRDNGVEKAIVHFCSFDISDVKHQLVLKYYHQLKQGLALKSIPSSMAKENSI